MHISDVFPETQVAEHPAPLCQFLVIRDHHAALAGRYMLIGIKAECTDIAKASAGLSLISLSVHLSRVLNHFQVILLCQCKDFIHLNWKSIQMNNHNGFCLRCYFSLDLIHLHVPGMYIAVYQYWHSAQLCHRRGTRYDRKARHDHFIVFSNPKSLYCYLQSCCTVGYGNTISPVYRSTHLLLKFLYKRTLR